MDTYPNCTIRHAFLHLDALRFTQTIVSCAAILFQLINALVYIYTEFYSSRNGYLVIPKAAA